MGRYWKELMILGKKYKVLGYLIGCFLFSSILLAFIFAVTFPVWAAGSKQEKGPAHISLPGKKGKEPEMTDINQLNNKEGEYLLSVARKTIEEKLFKKEYQPESDLSPLFSEQRGTFVTLTIDNNLRGCIGHIIPQETLIEGIRVNAINAAFRDPRFRPLTGEEWEKVKIEVSILTEPKSLSYSDADDLLNKLRPGIDGVIIKKEFHQATFLPQVWEQLPDKKEFLIHLCVKAGMDGYAWKKEKLEVYTYQAQAFEEH